MSFGDIPSTPHGHRVVLYGPGGIGKTTLCANLPGPVAIFDLEESLRALRNNLTEQGLAGNIRNVNGITKWSELRSALQGNGWDGIKSIVIDSGTKAEELAVAHTLESVPMEGGKKSQSIEHYGYGKGYMHVYEQFTPLLADLDRHSREGRHVVIICHDCTATVPNPEGEDFLRYEPRLQSPASGKASIRLKVREWADHVLFLGYDVAVGKDGVAKGSGSKTLRASERPHWMAKSRVLNADVPVTESENIWSYILS